MEIIRSNKSQGIFDSGNFNNPYTIVDTPFLILPANSDRVKFSITNTGNEPVYIDYVNSVSSEDYSFMLFPGEQYIEENFTYGGNIYVGTTTGDTTTVVVDELIPSLPPVFPGGEIPFGASCARYLVSATVSNWGIDGNTGLPIPPFTQTLEVTGRILGVSIFPFSGQTNYTVLGERLSATSGACDEVYWVSYIVGEPGYTFVIDSIVPI